MKVGLSQALVAGLYFVSLPTMSQEALNWKTAIEEVSRSNPQLKASRQSLKSAHQSIRTTQSIFYPQVSASLTYDFGTVDSTLLNSGQGVDPKGGYNASISLAQPLFTGGGNTARVDQARTRAQSSELILTNTKAQLSFDLKSAYASLVYAQRAVLLQDDIIRRRQENLRLVELRFESGRENKGSVLLSEAYHSQARFEAMQAKNNLKIAQAQLERILGRESEAELHVADEVPVGQVPGPLDWKNLARATPEYQQALVQVEAAKLAINLARAAYFPTLGVSGSLARRGEDFFPDRENWSVGLTLSYPLYNGGRDSSAVLEAQYASSAAGLNQENKDRELVAKLQQSYAAWIEAIEKLKVDEGFARAAQVRADVARSKYNNGLISFEDWDLIESELITRQRGILLSQNQRVVTEANWELLQGKGVIP